MTRWRRNGKIWSLWPSKPVGLIELVGGSYLANNPQITYRRLIEGLAKLDFAVNAWSYLPALDHQTQANEAWKEFRFCRKNLEGRVGSLPKSIRLGHSLGCKLHLLAPDGGRNSRALIALSFNNFSARDSIPMIGKLSSRLGMQSEFSPSPKRTIQIISNQYLQPRNLIVKFNFIFTIFCKKIVSHFKFRNF